MRKQLCAGVKARYLYNSAIAYKAVSWSCKANDVEQLELYLLLPKPGRISQIHRVASTKQSR